MKILFQKETVEALRNEAVDELSTVRDFVRWGASLFNEAELCFGHGTDNALDEAAALVLHTLHLTHDLPPEMAQAKLTKREKNTLADILLRRVIERAPTPYLTREAWFGGLSFYVDERVLIPRSPIAELIEKHFDPWIVADRIEHILDLCTGSACIAIACAHALPEAYIDAADISSAALDVARINIARHDVGNRVNAIESDLFTQLSGKKYDVIISNPPYVDHADMMALPEEFRHEPALALAAGESGLDIVARILEEADKHLKPRGIIIIEVGNSQAAMPERFPTLPLLWLEFERGEDGVFLLTCEELRRWRRLGKPQARESIPRA